MKRFSQIYKPSVKKVERFFCLTSRGSGVRLPLLPLKEVRFTDLFFRISDFLHIHQKPHLRGRDRFAYGKCFQ